jgi:hypothetical protein
LVMATRKEHNRRPGRSSSQLCRPTTRARIYARDGHKCVWCGAGKGAGLSLDHVVPRAEGGSDRFWNLVTACLTCNARRRHTPAHEFARTFGFEEHAIAARILRAIGTPLSVLKSRPKGYLLPRAQPDDSGGYVL